MGTLDKDLSYSLLGYQTFGMPEVAFPVFASASRTHTSKYVCKYTYLNLYLRCVRWRNAPVSRVSTIHFSVNFRKDDDDMVKSCRPCEASGNAKRN